MSPLEARVSFAPLSHRIAALRGEWLELAAEASEPNPFSEWWFLAASVRHLGGSGPRLAEVRSGERLIGLVPLSVEARYGRVPVRVVENWHHHHHFLGTPLIRSGHEERFWHALVLGLDGAAWAPGFLHLRGLAADGPAFAALTSAAARLGRPAPVVYREQRAFLHSGLGAEAYYACTVRKKKRKELARLKNRLAEQGVVDTRRFGPRDDLDQWCDEFLALERAGWKGRNGTALACSTRTETFFREALARARDADRLQILRMDLDGRPIAMLINFLTPPGSFSFKTAFDERLARFSPGVLIQIDNLQILEQPGIDWMDSCAAQEHPMIDSLWGERRELVRVSVPLGGARRRLSYAAARVLERSSAGLRRLWSWEKRP